MSQLVHHGFCYCFTKEQRLLNAKDFKGVFNQVSFKVHQPHLLVFVKVTNLGETSRLGLAITKKKVKRANERNRIKRLAREYFRLHQANFSTPVEMVVMVKQTTVDLSNAQITEQFAQAFKQIAYKSSKITQSQAMLTNVP